MNFFIGYDAKEDIDIEFVNTLIKRASIKVNVLSLKLISLFQKFTQYRFFSFNTIYIF